MNNAVVQFNMNPALTALCQYIAADFNWSPISKHLRKKFATLDDVTFFLQYAEFLKFIYLRSKYGKGFIPVAKEIDLIWHEFILQTREYEALCLSLPGKHFIHHNSVILTEYEEQKDRLTTIQELLDWIPHYLNHFGPFTEQTAAYWMVVTFLQKELQLTLEDINQLKK